MLILQRLLEHFGLLLGQFRRFRRQRIIAVCPRAKIDQLAPLRAKWPKFIARKLSFFSASRTFNDWHNET